MKSVLIMVAAVAALVVPVSASGVVNQTDFKNASKFCKALRSDMNATTPGSFNQTYGTNKNRSNAFGKCVSKNAKTVDQIHSTAVQQCKAAKAKPLGKCVSQTEHQAQATQQAAIVNAAKTCASERAADPAAFRQKYGTNHNKRNAFGKCVSQHVKASQ
jgi:hypothetical protein